MKRTDYITWDEYFMGVALLSAKRSKDPNTQVGACLVNTEKESLVSVIMVFLVTLTMMFFRGKMLKNYMIVNMRMSFMLRRTQF